MRRVLLLAVLMAVPVLLGLGAANAAKPSITSAEAFEVQIPFPDVCDFEMTATVRGRTHSITFMDANGDAVRGLSAGQLFVTWTRDDTGASRTFAIPGPTFSDATGTPIRGTGRWTTPLAGTGWVLANGNLTFDGFEDGFSLIASYKGNVREICDLMA
jgi:hypothetical protein